MPMPRRRRIAAALFAAVLADVGIVALIAGGPASAAAPSSTAPASAGTAKATSVAKLVIIEPGASIRRAGKTEFKPAKDGAKLRVGDTIQTDGTGFVEIDYTDDSFTRLDIDTTFTIISLTDDEGNRKIDGSLDSGRAWNRTSALTESESFEQEGAGATAAVVGTAFLFECDGAGHCTVTSVVDGIKYTSVDGDVQFLDPLQACTADELSTTDTDLCDNPIDVPPDALSAFAALNLYLDSQRGLPGIAPKPISGTIEDGVVTPTTVDTTPAGSTPPGGSTPAPPTPPPVIDPTNPIACYGGCGDFEGVSIGSLPPGYVEGNEIQVYDDGYVDFVANYTDSSGSPVYIVFSHLPDGSVGAVYICGDSGCDDVFEGISYSADTIFTFTPSDVGNPPSESESEALSEGDVEAQCGPPATPAPAEDTIEFHLVGAGGTTTPETVIPVTVDDADVGF
jgi:hypothetical protein